MRILGYVLLIFGGLFFGAAVGLMFGIENAGARLLMMGGGVWLALKVMPPREEPKAIDAESWREPEPQQPPSQTYIDNRKVYNITAATPEEAARALAKLKDEDD